MAKRTREDFDEYVEKINIVRSVVYVAAAALDPGVGDTDLELHTARALGNAGHLLDEVYDELTSLGREIRLPTRETREVVNG